MLLVLANLINDSNVRVFNTGRRSCLFKKKLSDFRVAREVGMNALYDDKFFKAASSQAPRNKSPMSPRASLASRVKLPKIGAFVAVGDATGTRVLLEYSQLLLGDQSSSLRLRNAHLHLQVHYDSFL